MGKIQTTSSEYPLFPFLQTLFTRESNYVFFLLNEAVHNEKLVLKKITSETK